MLAYIMQILLILWVISVLGYVFTVIKEKLYLKNNMIVIENKWLTQEDLDKADIKEFIFNGVKVRFGDEIKIVTNGNDIFKGILIGATKKDGSIVMVTYDNKVKMLDINDIVKFRLISKYGRFF